MQGKGGRAVLIQAREPNRTAGYMQIPIMTKPLKPQAEAVSLSEYRTYIMMRD